MPRNGKRPRKPWSDADKRTVFRASGGRCVDCGRRFRFEQRGGKDGWTIDHIVPHDVGGSNDVQLNGQLLCQPCNNRKGNKMGKRDTERAYGRFHQRLGKLERERSRGGSASGAEGRGAGRRRCRNCGNSVKPGFEYCRDCGCRWRGCRKMAEVNMLGALLEYCPRHMNESIYGPPARWPGF